MEVLFDIVASKMYAATSLGTLFLTFLLFFVVPALVLGSRLEAHSPQEPR
jgi:hypothetical protein